MSTEGPSYDGGPADDPPTEPAEPSSGSSAAGEPDYRLLLLGAVIPVVIVTAILVRVIANRPHDSNAHPGTLTVTVPAQLPAAGCQAPAASALATQGNALRATVTAVSDRDVTLQPTRIYRGGAPQRVVVELPAAPPPAALRMPTFKDGAAYLLAIGSDGTLAGCGLTAVESPSLESLYTKAFG